MCYAIPGKVVSTEGNITVIDYFGEERRAYNEFFTLNKDEYVYAQGGFVVQKVPEQKALEVLDAWRDMFFKLKDVDRSLTRLDKIDDNMNPQLKKIFNKASYGKGLARRDIERLFKIEDPKEKEYLFKLANFIRQKSLDNACCVHGIIEFSNYCRKECVYCGICKSNTKIPRYRLDVDQILEIVDDSVNRLGFKALVLQSGEDPYYTKDKLVSLVKKIRENFPVLIFLSVGNRNKAFYKAVYDAGCRAVLFRFESSSRVLYKAFKPNDIYKQRIDHLSFFKEIGYLIATGGLLGLPGQTQKDFINDMLLAKDFKPEMYSFGPFIPHPHTPLADEKPIDIEEVLKFIAISRLVDPKGKILVTTALETLSPSARRRALLAGANSFMLNITPARFKKLYDIYPNRATVRVSIEDQIKEALDLLKSLGRAPTDLGI